MIKINLRKKFKNLKIIWKIFEIYFKKDKQILKKKLKVFNKLKK
jgi:hypothetical protein